MKKFIYLLIISFLSTVVVFAMENNQIATKKSKIEENDLIDLDFLLNEEESHVNLLQDKLVLAIKKEVFDLNLEQLAKILESEEVELLDTDTRKSLSKVADDKFEKLFAFNKQAQEFKLEFTNQGFQEKLNFDNQLIVAKKIKNYLNAFIVLEEGFRFPQALFNPAPYNLQDPRPSLDSILEALIKNEQKKIQVCCYHFTLYNIANCLVQQKNNEEIEVDILTNKEQGGENPILKSLKYLIENNISVKAPKRERFENNHHKFILFTTNVGNKRLLWQGSYNLTAHSNINSWEDVTINDSPQVIKKYLNRFAEISNLSKPITLQELTKIKTRPSQWSLTNNNIPINLK